MPIVLSTCVHEICKTTHITVMCYVLSLSNIVPTPDTVNVTAPNIQIVGQSLTLECSVTTVRGITSRVDIVWKTGALEIETVEDINSTVLNYNSELYQTSLLIPQLSTTDDGRVYQCEVVIDTSPPVMATGSVTLDVTVPTPTVNITPSGPIQGATVGSPQDIQCTVSTVSGVELSSVMIIWMGPGGDAITNDSRVIISPTSGSGNNYTSSLQFMYLMEGDEGTYECNVMILETNGSDTVQISSVAGKLLKNTHGCLWMYYLTNVLHIIWIYITTSDKAYLCKVGTIIYTSVRNQH